MKISELIKQLEEAKDKIGDRELVIEDSDGRASWKARLGGISIQYKSQWYDQDKAWYVSLVGRY